MIPTVLLPALLALSVAPDLTTEKKRTPLVTVPFEELALTRTRVVRTAMGRGAGEDRSRAHAHFERAWPQVLAGFSARFTAEGRTSVAGGAR